MRNLPRIALWLVVLSLSAVVTDAAPCPAATKLIAQLQRGETPDAPALDGCQPDFLPELAKALAAFMIEKPREFEGVVPRIFDAFLEQDWVHESTQLAAATRTEYETQLRQRSVPRSLETLAGRLYTTQGLLAASAARFNNLLPWLVTALALAVFLSLAGVARQLRPLFAARAEPSFRSDPLLETIVERVNALCEALTSAVAELRDTPGRHDGSLDELLQRFPPDLDLRMVPSALVELRTQMTRLAEERETRSSVPPPPGDQLQLEREALAEVWKNFRDNKELFGAYEHASSDAVSQQVRELLTVQLPKYLPEDLKPRHAAALVPLVERQRLVLKISLIPQLVDGKLERQPAAMELRRIHELAHLLMSTQTSTAVMDRLSFRLEPWIEETFVGFADIYLQRYQEALVEGRQAQLEEGAAIVRKVLRIANLEPVELTLGQTLFDSTQHIGRSATSDARFPDGVIVAVVHNGFVHGGRDVIRQPEVIVNRMR